MTARNDDDFTFEIVDRLGLINTTGRGWYKELNKVSWNGNEAKFDIRDWQPDHSKMGRGITLTEDELIKVANLIHSRYPDRVPEQSPAGDKAEEPAVF